MIGAILQIILSIPYGVFFHRERFDLIFSYLFIFIAIFGISSVTNPKRAIEVIATTTLAEYAVATIRGLTGAGIGVIISYLAKKAGK